MNCEYKSTTFSSVSNLFITLKNNKMTGQVTKLFLKDKICNKMLKKYKFIYIFSCITLKNTIFKSF